MGPLQGVEDDAYTCLPTGFGWWDFFIVYIKCFITIFPLIISLNIFRAIQRIEPKLKRYFLIMKKTRVEVHNIGPGIAREIRRYIDSFEVFENQSELVGFIIVYGGPIQKWKPVSVKN